MTALGISTVAATGIALAPKALARGRVETPSYTVEAEHGAFEVRRYAARIVAEVTVEGEAEQATNVGFRILADFIFGNNSKRSEVAMTAPVDRTSSEAIAMTAPVDRTSRAAHHVIAFTMPSKYTLETLPQPNDARVSIREIPEQRYAVLRFSGAPKQSVVDTRMQEFVALVEATGLTPSGAPPTYARYDPPWTPGLFRRNEIFVELRDGSQ